MAHILIVDDDRNVLDTLSDAYIIFGHIVTLAENGLQGYEIFKRNGEEFDVAVIDVEMPYMNGLELTQKIKELKPNFPVILITAYSHLYRPQDVLGLDVEAFLKKPLNIQELVNITEGIIERYQADSYS